MNDHLGGSCAKRESEARSKRCRQVSARLPRAGNGTHCDYPSRQDGLPRMFQSSATGRYLRTRKWRGRVLPSPSYTLLEIQLVVK